MYTPHQLFSVHDFLLHTPEGALRKMLRDDKTTDVHINLLLKIVKVCPKEKFAEMVEKNNFPVMKFSANEMKIKETFWGTCCATLESRGLLGKAKAAA